MEEILDKRAIKHFGQKGSENETDLSYSAGEKLSKFVVVVVRSSELGWDR